MARRRRGQGVSLVLVVAVVIWAFYLGLTHWTESDDSVVAPPSMEGVFTLIVFDVGQADSLLVRTPNGKAMLVDAGDSDKDADEVILPGLRELGVTELDYLVLTHAHQDHVGGMPSVLKSLPVGVAVFSGEVSTNSTYRDFLALVQSGEAKPLQARRGLTLDMGGDVVVEVLNPPEKLFDESNDNSVVLRLTYGQVSMMLTGDAESEAIESMKEAMVPMNAAVLKVGHHGSSDATSQWLLRAVSPQYALISVGADNRYGHPHAETMELLRDGGVEVYRTDQQGTITVTTDGSSVDIVTTKAGE